MKNVTFPTARIWVALLLVWAAAVSPALAQRNSSLIDANAKLHIVVANEAQLTGDYTVDADGNITMLYINQVHVQGLTPAQAAALIRGEAASGGKKATGLTQFYVSPQVVVSITDQGGIGIDVTGLVTAPKHYVVRSDAHLNDVLQDAVPALNADLSKIELTRGTDKQTVDYRAYLDNKVAAGNPALHDGDVVNVASHDPLPIFINIQGQVGKPGRFAVPANTTAYTALQTAGGPTVTANMSGIFIKHFGAGPDEKIAFNNQQAGLNPTDATLNPVLLDGDTIIVPAATVSQTYTITGPGVRSPAEYALTNGQPITLAEAIGKAGGLSDRAKISEVQIIRTSPTQQTIKLNATDPKVQGTYLVQAGDNITINQGNAPSKVDPFSVASILIAIYGIFGHH